MDVANRIQQIKKNWFLYIFGNKDNDLDLAWGDYYQQSLYIIWNIGTAEFPRVRNAYIRVGPRSGSGFVTTRTILRWFRSVRLGHSP